MGADATESTAGGAARVLAVLAELANHADGIALSELAERLRQPRSSVHRALGVLVEAGLARRAMRGRYILGDEFLRLAFSHYAERPDSVRVVPILEALAAEFGETAHYAVLEGRNVVYRAKVDPPVGAFRLTSAVGGSNPAHSTAVGKLLLSFTLRTLADVEEWIGVGKLAARTPTTKITAADLSADLDNIRTRGFATDAEENEPGVNCVAFPVRYTAGVPDGAISISAIAYRTPLHRLVARADEISHIIAERRPLASPEPLPKEYP
jgi:DNA-binding IclR family transcriptional regulator